MNQFATIAELRPLQTKDRFPAVFESAFSVFHSETRPPDNYQDLFIAVLWMGLILTSTVLHQMHVI